MEPADREALEGARRDPRRQVGRYLLLRELGRGGMGAVYRAADPAAGRLVALKVMLEDDPAHAARFAREAEAVARLQHPGIVTIYELGRWQGRPFAAMELVEGRALDRLPPLPVAQALDLAAQVAAALAHAHARGVLHRDVKPANILVDAAGRARLLDFGLARLDDRSRLTRTGSTLGTPAFMPPEQLEGQADARSDVYGLGATLFTLLTGQPPFGGGSTENIIVAVLRKAPPRPSSLNPAVPAAVDALVLRCLEKDPAARFPDAAALGQALADAQAGRAPARPPRRRRTTLAVAAALALPAAAAGGLALARRTGGEAAPVASAAGPAPRDPAPPRPPARREDEAARRVTALVARGDLAAARALVAGCDVAALTTATVAALLRDLGRADGVDEGDPRPALRALRAGGRLTDDAARALIERHLAAAAARADAVSLGASVLEVTAGYRRAVVPYRVALALDPERQPPEALARLATRLVGPPATPEGGEAQAHCHAYYKAFPYARPDRKAGCDALARTLRALEDRATTRAARLDVACAAVEALVDDAQAVEAAAWICATRAAGPPGDPDVEARAAAFAAYALFWAADEARKAGDEATRAARRAEADAVLAEVLDADPLHGEARLARAWMHDLEEAWAPAAADLRLAVHDPGRWTRIRMRGGGAHPYQDLARACLRLGDLAGARAAVDRFGSDQSPSDDDHHARLRAALEAREAAGR